MYSVYDLETLRWEVEEHIGIVKMDNPPVNAHSMQMLVDMQCCPQGDHLVRILGLGSRRVQREYGTDQIGKDWPETPDYASIHDRSGKRGSRDAVEGRGSCQGNDHPLTQCHGIHWGCGINQGLTLFTAEGRHDFHRRTLSSLHSPTGIASIAAVHGNRCAINITGLFRAEK
jgi:hypothetical protein